MYTAFLLMLEQCFDESSMLVRSVYREGLACCIGIWFFQALLNNCGDIFMQDGIKADNPQRLHFGKPLCVHELFLLTQLAWHNQRVGPGSDYFCQRVIATGTNEEIRSFH